MNQTLERLSAEYDSLAPAEDNKLATRLSEIDTLVMRGAVAERFTPKEELQKLLSETTAIHSYFAGRAYKWVAILKNQTAESFFSLKQSALSAGEKFVSGAAEHEAEYATREIRSMSSFYEGQVKRCEEYINTCKRLLDTIDGKSRKEE